MCKPVFEDECNFIIHIDNGLIPIFIFFPYLLVHVHNEMIIVNWIMKEMEFNFEFFFDSFTTCNHIVTCSLMFPFWAILFLVGFFLALGGHVDFWHPYQHTKFFLKLNIYYTTPWVIKIICEGGWKGFHGQLKTYTHKNHDHQWQHIMNGFKLPIFLQTT